MISMVQTSFDARQQRLKAARQGGHGRRLASTLPPGVQNTRVGQSFRYLSTKTTDTPYLPRLISKNGERGIFGKTLLECGLQSIFLFPQLFDREQSGWDVPY